MSFFQDAADSFMPPGLCSASYQKMSTTISSFLQSLLNRKHKEESQWSSKEEHIIKMTQD